MAARATESELLQRQRSAKPVLIMAVFLLGAGTFLFMSNIGLLPVHNPWAFWPVALVAVGVAKLADSRTRGEHTWSILMMIFGVMFLLVSVGVFHVRLHDGSWPVSILLIAMGIAGLAKALDATSVRKRPAVTAEDNSDARRNDVLNDSVVLGVWKRRFETPHFRGGQVQSIFGTAEIDLRRAQIRLEGGSSRRRLHGHFRGQDHPTGQVDPGSLHPGHFRLLDRQQRRDRELSGCTLCSGAGMHCWRMARPVCRSRSCIAWF
jgi:hypothetical protein